MVTRHFYYFLVVILVLPCEVSAKDTILWQTYHRPPGTFNYGEYQGQGFVQKTLQLVIDRMPEYQHEMPITTLARAISDIAAGQNVCHPSLFITAEREKYMLFSNAVILNPSNRVIAKPASIVNFLENGQVNLAKLLQQDGLLFGHVKNRSYGDTLDDMFKKYRPTKEFISIENITLDRVFKLIERDRIDLTIAYPFEVEHYLQKDKLSKGQLVAYAIKNISPYITGSIACPKNTWGEKIIEKVNRILKEIKPTIEYQHAVTAWRESERDSAVFIQYYHEYFLNH